MTLKWSTGAYISCISHDGKCICAWVIVNITKFVCLLFKTIDMAQEPLTNLHKFNSSSHFDWNNCISFIVDGLRYKYCFKNFEVELRNDGTEYVYGLSRPSLPADRNYRHAIIAMF